jgi:hypothetical protein
MVRERRHDVGLGLIRGFSLIIKVLPTQVQTHGFISAISKLQMSMVALEFLRQVLT